MKSTRLLLFLLGFVTARGGLFFAPIVLANLMPLENYGALESAQAISTLIALIAGFGLSSSAPLIHLGRGVRARWDTLLWIILLLSGVAITGAFFAILFYRDPLGLHFLISISVGLLLLQNLWSATLKARGYGSAALFLDAGFWFSALVGACVSFFVMTSDAMAAIAVGCYALALWLTTMRSYVRKRRPFVLADIRDNIKLGVPLMSAALLTLLVSSSGRIILSITSDPSTTGAYSVLFRATALPLVGHQMLVAGFFRQLYTWDENTLERVSPIIPLGVVVFVVVFWSFSDLFGWVLGKSFVDAFSIYRTVGLIVLAQTILWSGIAINDLLNARFHIAAFVTSLGIPFVFLGLVLLIGAMLLESSGSTVRTLLILSVGQSVLMFGFYLIQCLVAVRKGRCFWRLWVTVGAAYLLVAGLIAWDVMWV